MKVPIIFLAIPVLFACTAVETPIQQAEAPGRTVVFTATCGTPDTRTQRDETGKMYWSPGDQIKVWTGYNNRFLFTSSLTAPSPTAAFTGTLTSGEYPDYVALYPYAKDGQSISYEWDEDYYEILTDIPMMQTAMEGSFRPGYFVSAARSKTTNLHFQHACGGVKFSVSTPGIRKALLHTETTNIAGGTYIFVWPDHVEAMAMNNRWGNWVGYNEVTLTAPDGGSFNPGSSYFFVTAPATMNEGFTLSFYTDTHFAVRTISKPVEIQGGHFATLLNADDGLTWKPLSGDLEDTTDTPIE